MKLLEENIGEKLLDIDLGNDFFEITPKAQATKSKQVGLYQTKKLLHSKKKLWTKWKQNLQSRKKYLQTIYLIRGYPKYRKNSYNSIAKNKQTNKLHSKKNKQNPI